MMVDARKGYYSDRYILPRCVTEDTESTSNREQSNSLFAIRAVRRRVFHGKNLGR
jgi:hypothetical protein